jgi:hypothetical protein
MNYGETDGPPSLAGKAGEKRAAFAINSLYFNPETACGQEKK